MFFVTGFPIVSWFLSGDEFREQFAPNINRNETTAISQKFFNKVRILLSFIILENFLFVGKSRIKLSGNFSKHSEKFFENKFNIIFNTSKRMRKCYSFNQDNAINI